MSKLRNVFGGCVSDKSAEAASREKIKFGVPLSAALKNGYLPRPIVELLVYIAKEGVTTNDLFRRPGNPNDMRHIVKRLSEGKPVIFANYNFYTLASVVKKFVLKIPGGIFGPEGEEHLLQVLNMVHRFEQCQWIHEFLESLSPGHQQLISLLFGTWFRIVNHSDVNSMSVEALARSVAGSIFPKCVEDPLKVEKAIRMMQLLIDNFGVANMFGQENIEYFTQVTRTGIHVREKFRYQYNYPSEEILPRAEALQWLALLLQEEAKKHGFDLSKHAITEEEFFDAAGSRGRGDHQSGSASLGRDRPVSSADTQGITDSNLIGNVTTASAPEVSTIPSPEFSKRPKSLEDNLNERTGFQSRCLNRYNSVKRRQLERLRQRSDWFLGPVCSGGENCHEGLKLKTSGNSVTKASSEGAVLDVLGSDADSVFTDTTSRSESPASEPIRSHTVREKRDIIHSDTLADMSMSREVCDSRDITDDDLTESRVCYFLVEHKYGEAKS